MRIAHRTRRTKSQLPQASGPFSLWVAVVANILKAVPPVCLSRTGDSRREIRFTVARGLKKLQKRKAALRQLGDLFDQAEHAIVIHYSCESFYDTQADRSPRITSIAVRNLQSAQTTSFSISQLAERRRIAPEDIDAHYDELERAMLDDFYEFARQHAAFTWVHWNMRDINYGFPALAHRYQVLGGAPPAISEDRLVDLSRLLVAIYGVGYIAHPRLRKLMDKNDITDQHFLDGESEAAAFAHKEYRKLHLSTLRKVDVLAGIAQRAEDGLLRTNERWRDRWGAFPEAMGEVIRDHWLFIVIAFIGGIASTIGLWALAK